MAKTAKKDPTAIAREFADGQIEAQVGPEMEWSTDQGFEAVIKALIEQVPAHQQKHVLTLSQVVELQDRITTALPEALQKDFSRLSEWENLELNATWKPASWWAWRGAGAWDRRAVRDERRRGP